MPRQFWGYYDNGTYRVGCNGATIFVYDQSATLLRRFSDISYMMKRRKSPRYDITRSEELVESQFERWKWNF